MSNKHRLLICLIALLMPALLPAQERLVRAWAQQYGRVQVVCGPYVTDNAFGTIGERRVVVSVDAVEALTGFDFFPNLPDDIEEIIESASRWEAWQ